MKPVLTCQNFKTRIADAFSMARVCRQTHAELMERLELTVYSELKRKTGKAKPKAVYSAYVHGYVSACCEAQTDLIYRNDLEYCHIVDGVIYSTHKESVHRLTEEFYGTERGCELSNAPSGHYWKFSDKPYFNRTIV